jgi:hypothetical protein
MNKFFVFYLFDGTTTDLVSGDGGIVEVVKKQAAKGGHLLGFLFPPYCIFPLVAFLFTNLIIFCFFFLVYSLQ